MAPPLFSPAELSYLQTSLSLTPPIRPDSRKPRQFRPLVAETDILPSTHGSARMVWGDGEECIVGVKAEVEKIPPGETWNPIEVSVEVQGQRDDDPLPVFLTSVVSEALGVGELTGRLRIGGAEGTWGWRLFIDILLLTPPLSHPTTLLSLTTHLALTTTKLPRLISKPDEDPLFDDDWGNALPLYPPTVTLPPITLLVVSIEPNIFFDPTREELAVCDCVLAVSIVNNSGVYKVVGIRTLESGARVALAEGGKDLEVGEKQGVGRAVVKKLVKESLEVAQEVFGSLKGVL
ncbi:Exosome complex component rrp42 [Rhizina undulata]